MHKSDLIIIGAGPGGYETALAAAHRGMKTVLFEGAALGGTCLNAGCIPTKCLCKNAEVMGEIKESEAFGVNIPEFSVDFTKVMDRKNTVVSQLNQGIAMIMKSAGVEVVNAYAKFVDAKTVEADGEQYTADNIIIATGSVSKSLPIEGHDLDCVMDSTDILNINYIPESLTIIGGGVIGMEFADIFNTFGTKVTVVEFMPRILPPFDSDISKRLKTALSKKGVKIITGAAASKIEETEEGKILLTYNLKGKEATVESTDLLMAVGRAPRVDGLNLEATGVEYSQRGIAVNDNMQTNVEGIYAIGDVNARMMLAHVATFQGYRALNAIEGKKDEIDFSIVPSAVFTRPECGMAGMTEDQCKEKEIPVKIGQSFFRANGKSLCMAEPDGLVKLIFHAETGKMVGAHIMGVEAADLAQQCADLMNAGMTRERMKDIIFGHPTVSEVLMAAIENVK